ncbi:MAG: hypothetical protein QM758_15835 [Armatimonas sp.]
MDDALQYIQENFPDTTFLALGQTALWDEPTKAAVRLRLDAAIPGAKMLVGAHDTDYFAKLPGHPAAARQNFALVGHDDATTRGLWSAAGEMSELFGSEDVPTRALLQREGNVSLHHATSFKDDSDAALAELTRTWGWTGIIHGGWKKEVVGQIRLAEILPTLTEQIRWAFDGSLSRLDSCRAECGAALRDSLLARIESFAAENPQATLPQLYRNLLPFLYEMVLGAPANNLETIQTTELLRLAPDTAHLPRFSYVELFLNPETRETARAAYNLALGDADAYTLDQFGEGALPFDIVLAKHGRGTLHILPDSIQIDTPHPITLPGTVSSVAELAERLVPLGPATLVGKAVAMLPMLASEFVFVFHEGASGYTHRTRAMLAELKKQGLRLPNLRPILRVKYDTWTALSAVPDGAGICLKLPEFLAQALDRPSISLDDFAQCWPRAIQWEKERLADLHGISSPRALLTQLANTRGCSWKEKAAQHDQATENVLNLYAKAREFKEKESTQKAHLRSLKSQANTLQLAKGDDFRDRGSVLDAAAIAEREVTFDQPLTALRTAIEEAEERWHALRRERKALEHGPELKAAREALRKLESEAEYERAILVRNALQTIHGIPHTAVRPSAWWFPLVDPSGSWLREVARTAQLSLEPLAP